MMGKTQFTMGLYESFHNGPFGMFVDIKFSKLGAAFAYGYCLSQDDHYPHYSGSINAAFYEERKILDAKALDPIKTLSDVRDEKALGRELLNEMFSFQELNAQFGARGKFEVWGNKMTLTYLQALIQNRKGRRHGVQFLSFDDFFSDEANVGHTLRTVGLKHGLTDLPFNPVSTARAMAVACYEKQVMAA